MNKKKVKSLVLAAKEELSKIPSYGIGIAYCATNTDSYLEQALKELEIDDDLKI